MPHKKKKNRTIRFVKFVLKHGKQIYFFRTDSRLFRLSSNIKTWKIIELYENKIDDRIIINKLPESYIIDFDYYPWFIYNKISKEVSEK